MRLANKRAVVTGAAESLLLGTQYARSGESRALQFVRVPFALSASPWFGFGYARNIIDLVDVGHVDSFFLQTALEGGLFTLVILLAVMYGSTRLVVAVAADSTDRSYAIIARHLAVSMGFAFLLSLVLSLSDIRFYVFLFIGLSIVLHQLALSEKPDYQSQDVHAANGVLT